MSDREMELAGEYMDLTTTISELSSDIVELTAENIRLREALQNIILMSYLDGCSEAYRLRAVAEEALK